MKIRLNNVTSVLSQKEYKTRMELFRTFTRHRLITQIHLVESKQMNVKSKNDGEKCFPVRSNMSPHLSGVKTELSKIQSFSF